MLSIDEMIELHKMKARASKNFNARTTVSYATEEHEQLAKWLEELKAYRASVFSGDMTQKMLKEEYCKAVDDFAEALREKRDKRTLKVGCDDLELRKFAEQLKVGGENEKNI